LYITIIKIKEEFMQKDNTKTEVFNKTCAELSAENREKLLKTAKDLRKRQREDEAMAGGKIKEKGGKR
jgi:Zn-dependent M16 (insulinase) family peptidase